MEQSLEVLARKLKTGDRQAAAQLVDIYYEQIYLYMRRLGHGKHASEDLTQETFLQAWQHIGHLRNADALNGWLYRIAANVSRMRWRGDSSRDTGTKKAALIAARQGAPGDAEEQEQLARLDNAVAALPMKLRQAIVLHYMQHLTIAEAAEAAGVGQGTLKSRLDRAIKSLRRIMDFENRLAEDGKGY